ncbi:MAG: Cof-type HAD-IIB family hydrolase [Clostridia bacterium]|jgi:Cof subfamily protein (haloacid dehalogenase superfamily)
MKFRLIAIDLDDSLLYHDLTVSQRNRKAIQEAARRGIIVTIATGRMYRATRPFIDMLDINVPVITYQGAMIVDGATNEILRHSPVPLEWARKIVDFAHQENVHIQVFLKDEYYFEEANRFSELYGSVIGFKGHPVGPLKDFLQEPPTKMIIIDEPQRILALQGQARQFFGNQLEISISKPHYLEFTQPDANKGKAVQYLANLLDIGADEVIAIGDSFNDIPMLSFACLGIAMGNAPQEVKDAADYVTASNNEDGVAVAIEKFALVD